jgi:hypothetical protein
MVKMDQTEMWCYLQLTWVRVELVQGETLQTGVAEMVVPGGLAIMEAEEVGLLE